MRRLILSMMVSLDGFFEGENHDISWHNVDADFNDFAIKQIGGIDTMIFGRKTYELMAGYWPTKEALRDDPEITKLMNATPKIVFSKSLTAVAWENTILKPDAESEISVLKRQTGKDMIIFGSSNLCVSLLAANLLDELHIFINPVVIGAGTPLFHGLNKKLILKLQNSQPFKNGNILLTYHPTI